MNISAAQIGLYLGAIASLAFLGGSVPLLRDWPRTQLQRLVAFGGGVLLGAAFIQMLPETAEALGRWMGLPVLAGFLVVFILEKYLLMHPCGEDECEVHSIGTAAFAGMSFHGLMDGMAVASSFLIPHLALPVLLAIVFHKLPCAFSLSTILLLANYSRRRTLMHLMFFSCTTPLGALLAYLVLRGRGDTVVAAAIGVSAGSFLAIATSDIMTQIHRSGGNRAGTLLSFLGGILLMALSAALPAH